ncbi:hypothetical protein LshimejAT787_0704600 [Lyophyllum shimeji]|uniref:Uncharacterized protein n=1 Tax=Lyophyllum shimeji TaxID=47721 RepID=A0A9P3PQ16_LYOSH|nr:hypothetical protein LshimejAT787_0704600 [Lyophyllum shimeji]
MRCKVSGEAFSAAAGSAKRKTGKTGISLVVACAPSSDLVVKGGGWSVFTAHASGANPEEIRPLMLREWTAVGVSEEDLQSGLRDSRTMRASYGSLVPPGGAQNPSEVAKVKELFEVMPFWEQEIV